MAKNIMNFKTAKHLRPLLKTTREMQQFKNFPLIFGNSEIPSSMLYKIEEKITKLEVCSKEDIKSLYGDFCKFLSAKQTYQRPDFIDATLFSAIQSSISNLNKSGMKIRCTDYPNFDYNLIDFSSWSGPFVLRKELNPHMDYLLQMRYGHFKLATNAEPYASVFKHRFAGRDQSTWDGLASKIDFNKLANKVSSLLPLEEKDAVDLLSFHIYLTSIRPIIQVAVVAIKGGSLVTIENRNGEAEDGEETPYTHVLYLERLKLDKEDRVVSKNFLTNKWVISDVDFLMTPDQTKGTDKGKEEEENEIDFIDMEKQFGNQ
ncbi:unnamed protein product [Blepharisma stoltei]|uniref:Tim44-like domain-containing protein n=1 Tax=Blepharisma stoltei TaxID=1481888 RepID=A0AAU9IV79_9CILI|nr:unnamed protein product [Blepharisma stoltei]